MCGLCSFQLSSSPNDDGGFIEVLESLTNLGPILAMSVVDLDKQGRDVVRLTQLLLIPSHCSSVLVVACLLFW